MDTTNPEGEVVDPVERLAELLDREEQGETDAPEDIEEETNEAEEETKAEESKDQPDADGSEVVEYEGKEYQVPKELKEALLRQADYTVKTQEIAEQRRLVEAQYEVIKAQEQVLAARDKFQQTALGELAEIKATENTISQYESINWQSLSDTDPVQTQKLWIQYQQEVQRHAKLSNGLQQKYTQFQQAENDRLIEATQKGFESLKKDIPDWSPEKAAKIRLAGRENYGFTESELSGITDPRMVKVLADAAAYRELKTSKPEQTKRVIEASKTIKPGAVTSKSQNDKAAYKQHRDNLKKSGDMRDAAKYIERFM
jgi:hypothetical protein